MALLKIRAKAKILISWGSSNLSFIRSINTTKDTSISYSSAVGQSYSAGQILYSVGQQGAVGYTAVRSRDNITLNGSGVMYLSVEHYPSSTEGNKQIVFNIDEAPATINMYYNSQPNTSDVIVETNNRTKYTFTVSDFTSHYSDFDNDAISEIQINGDVTGFFIAGTPLVSGQWINISDVQSGNLYYEPQDRSDYYEKDVTWKAKDINGNISVN